MLTKDLIDTTTRTGSIYPRLLDPDEDDNLSLANDVIQQIAVGKGQTEETICDRIQNEVITSRSKCLQGLQKLALDLAEFTVPDPSIQEGRWRIFELAQTLRLEGPQDFSRSDFEDRLVERARNVGLLSESEDQLSGLQSFLYSDLPERRILVEPLNLDSSALIYRYNTAQIQGLLMHATKVKIEFEKLSITNRRLLISTLKFSRLLWEVTDKAPDKESKDNFSVEISGPLTLFDTKVKYGKFFARWFPMLLWFTPFKLDAQISWQNKNLSLLVDKKTLKRLAPNSPKPSRYEPDWIKVSIDDFNSKNFEPWSIEACTDPVPLGLKSNCFADFKVINRDTDQYFYIECFHRWHASAVASRLSLLQAQPHVPLLLLVDHALLKKIPKDCSESRSIVVFREIIGSSHFKKCIELAKNFIQDQ